MMRLTVAIVATLALAGCGSLTTSELLTAVQLGPDECGSASISGNLDVGSNPIVSTDVHVTIDKEKKTYVDANGDTQLCDPPAIVIAPPAGGP